MTRARLHDHRLDGEDRKEEADEFNETFFHKSGITKAFSIDTVPLIRASEKTRRQKHRLCVQGWTCTRRSTSPVPELVAAQLMVGPLDACNQGVAGDQVSRLVDIQIW